MKSLYISAACALALVACQPAGTQQEETAAQEVNDSNTPLHLLQPDYNIPYGELSQEQLKEAIDRIYAYIDAQSPCELQGDTLARGAFRIGSYEWGITYQAMLVAAERTGDERYKEYVTRRFELLKQVYPQFAAQEEVKDKQMKQIVAPQALDDCGTMCTAMMKAAEEAGVEGLGDMIENYYAFIDHGQYRLPNSMFARHRPQHNTIWLDDMYMGIPTVAFRGTYCSDLKYYDEAASMYREFVKRMWVPEKGIYRHGYVEGLAQQPTYHWARANGWAILTTVELLDILPPTHEDYGFILNQLRLHVAGLAALQSSEGFWHQLLDRNDSYLETSATAIYTYCIARAVRKGWIEGVTYGPVAQLGMQALLTKITAEGKVEGTCVGTGMAFDPAFYYYRPVSAAAAHGYGPAIWALAEMYALLGEWHPRTNDSGLHYYEQEQTNPNPLFYVTEDGGGVGVEF